MGVVVLVILSPLPQGEGGARSEPGEGSVALANWYSVFVVGAVILCVMHLPTQRVRELRRNQTEAERAAWYLLRDRRLGAKFRRQCRIGKWVVDFYCFERRLAVEFDGSVHSQPSQMRRDAAKEDYLRTIGVHLLRIPNGLVLEDPEGFVRQVRERIEAVPDRAAPQ
ncbi:MAG TPA: endonuclease domain-containing protein [Terriglobia bacterium]|nr:endonuclease domain-containing protein [Terriglobia bacterium]